MCASPLVSFHKQVPLHWDHLCCVQTLPVLVEAKWYSKKRVFFSPKLYGCRDFKNKKQHSGIFLILHSLCEIFDIFLELFALVKTCVTTWRKQPDKEWVRVADAAQIHGGLWYYSFYTCHKLNCFVWHCLDMSKSLCRMQYLKNIKPLFLHTIHRSKPAGRSHMNVMKSLMTVVLLWLLL